MKKTRVEIIESERGWGQKVDEVREFDTMDEAVEFVEKYNRKNDNEEVPDWYMYARLENSGFRR